MFIIYSACLLLWSAAFSEAARVQYESHLDVQDQSTQEAVVEYEEFVPSKSKSKSRTPKRTSSSKSSTPRPKPSRSKGGRRTRRGKSGSGPKKGAGMENLLLLTDSYKVTHYVQYPPGTTTVYSYFEPRKGGLHKEVCMFGLQYIIKRYLTGKVVTEEKIKEAKEMYGEHFGRGGSTFYEEGWRYILENHGGKLPVVIKAVPEGFCMQESNAFITVENTDPKAYWVVNFLETLLVQVWYPMTIATNSREQKKLIKAYLEETGDPAGVDFKLHDFGFRGVSSVETAGLGAAAHLTQFLGTDTVAGLSLARDYYGAPMAGFSIPASEHSTMTSWGEANEVGAYKNMLDKYPTGLVAIVSDSYDVWKAVDIYGTQLYDDIINRNGTLVIRPDSGPPPLMVIELLRRLFSYFPSKQVGNKNAYKELDEHVRIIQGDGINIDMLSIILELLKRKEYSINNIAFGSGGGLLQQVDRDTQKCAFKCSYAVANGEPLDVIKKPIHSPGKKSKRGKLKVIKAPKEGVMFEGKKIASRGQAVTLTADTVPTAEESTAKDILVTVFENGDLKKSYTWDQVKKRADIGKYDKKSVMARAKKLADEYLQNGGYEKDLTKMAVDTQAEDSSYEEPF